MSDVSFYKTKTSANMTDLVGTPIDEGTVYFTQDSNEIYADLDGQRKTYGGNQKQVEQNKQNILTKVTSNGGDVSNTVVKTITTSTESFPIVKSNDSIKVTIGKVNKFNNDTKTQLDSITSKSSLVIARTVYRNNNITDAYYNGTLRAEIAKSNFNNVRVGDYIIGKVTNTKYIVVDINYWEAKGDTALWTPHLVIMPETLKGELLWTGETWKGSGVNNTAQSYAPMNETNITDGGYGNSYMKKTILPKVHTNWLQKDFDNNCIKFRNLLDNAINKSAPSVAFPASTGRASAWAWEDSFCDLPTTANILSYTPEPNIYGNACQSTQFALFEIKSYWEIFPRQWMWTKDVASVSYFCHVGDAGYVGFASASYCVAVRPFALLT